VEQEEKLSKVILYSFRMLNVDINLGRTAFGEILRLTWKGGGGVSSGRNFDVNLGGGLVRADFWCYDWEGCRSRGSSVSIVSDYGLNDRGSIPDRRREFFFWLVRPDRLWGPPSLLFNGYCGSLPRG
jgi:hypothetical protein